MNVIGCPARGDERETLATRNPAQVGMEFGGAGSRNERATLFGAEDTMNEIARVRMRHGTSSLRDSQPTTASPAPPLKRGANEHCSSGAHPRDGPPPAQAAVPFRKPRPKPR